MRAETNDETTDSGGAPREERASTKHYLVSAPNSSQTQTETSQYNDLRIDYD